MANVYNYVEQDPDISDVVMAAIVSGDRPDRDKHRARYIIRTR